MYKFKNILLATTFIVTAQMAQATTLAGAPAHIQAQVDAIEAQGYAVKEWRVTLLGRYDVEFTNSTTGQEREVVMSGTDGTILRDHTDNHTDTNGDGVIDGNDDDHGGHGSDDNGTDDSNDDSNDDHGSDNDSNDDDSNDDHGGDGNDDSNDDDNDHDSNDDHGSDDSNDDDDH